MNKAAEMIREKRFPYVTAVLIAVNVAYFLILVFGGNPGNSMYMLSRGADYAPYVFEQHQYWRLLTSMFMHFSLQHLGGNMIYLGIVGFTYENVTGHLKFLLIYMLAGLGGNVVSCAYHQITGQPVVSAGASGAVYGIIAIVIYLNWIARKRTGMGRLYQRLGIMLVFLFYSNFINGKGVDVAAHIGGLLFGLLLCVLLIPWKSTRRKQS